MRTADAPICVTPRRALAAATALAALFLGAAPAARAQFGDLAPGGAVRWSLSGVEAEVGVFFAMDPAFVAGRLPRGFRPVRLGVAAARGFAPGAAVLAAHPEFADFVIAVLSFDRVDSAAVEGEAAPARTHVSAFWWVPVRMTDTTAGLPDPRARAGEQEVELGYWSPDAPIARRIGAVMPTVVGAPVAVARDAGGVWRVRLTLPGGASVAGSCRPTDTSTPITYPLPQYATVWAADSVPGPFVVYTYYGHRSQPCEAAWTATGSSPLARALQTGAIFSTEDQTGWRARAAAYAAH